MPKSVQVSGFDVAARNYKALANEVINLGGGDDDMNRIHTDRDVRRQLAELLVVQPASTPAGPAGTIVASLELIVDHGKSVEEMAKAGGYNYTNSDITDVNFPHPREGEETVMIDLVKFANSDTTAERERQLAAYGELAEMDDMLTTGIQYPDEQRKYPIVFLGSAWVDPSGDRYVGYLNGDADYRRCYLHWGDPEGQWNPRYVFAVRRCK